ncbi:MAG: hypothetical protein HIU91_10115 [Acidobacteria bacterium]|nr:hypothetical protein [Acidobacteriota bacterium]
MKTSGNERLRMQAALRLADILSLREEREQLELRRELRDAWKAADAPGTHGLPNVSDTPVETRETAEQVTERILERYRTKGEILEQ